MSSRWSARPASSRPMRPRLKAASSRLTWAGRTCRASAVARDRSGTMTTKARGAARDGDADPPARRDLGANGDRQPVVADDVDGDAGGQVGGVVGQAGALAL